LISNFDDKRRYRVTGEFDAENRVMYFDMSAATVADYRSNVGKDE